MPRCWSNVDIFMSFTFEPSVKEKTGPPSPQMIAIYQLTKDAHKSTMLSQQAKTYSQGNAEAAALPSETSGRQQGWEKTCLWNTKNNNSGQPSVQCILQQRLPKALNSGSQNVLKCLTISRGRVQSGAKALSSQMHTVLESQMDTPCTTPTNWWRLHQHHLFLKIKMGDICST